MNAKKYIMAECRYCGKKFRANIFTTHGESFQGVCQCGCEMVTTNSGKTWNVIKMGTDPQRVQMVNPWSKALPPDKNWTWNQVKAWAKENVHPTNQAEWLKEAREAFYNDDGEQLGIMIIGS